VYNNKMRSVYEQPVHTDRKGTFIMHSAYFELKKGKEGTGPVGT